MSGRLLFRKWFVGSPAATRALAMKTFLVTAALAVPPLIVFGSEPFPSFYNQAIALLLWGALVHGRGLDIRCSARVVARSLRELLAAFGVIGLCAAIAAVWRTVPWGVASCNMFVLASGALVATIAGLRPEAADNRLPHLQLAFVRAVGLAACLNCVPAFAQVFFPQWIDGHWFSQAWSPDRISGNVRQPNLLATLCAWGIAAFVVLQELKKCSKRAAWMLVGVLLATLAATGSRVGAAEVLALSTWSAIDRRLSRDSRLLLFASPFILLCCWLALRWWASLGGAAYGRAPELASGRYAMWGQCLFLIAAHPWWGVGMGNFNIAWTLTPFDRSSNPETFDNAHNLVLQWAVELGIPTTLVLVGLIVLSLRRCMQRTQQTTGDESIVRRFCLVMIALAVIHSMTEYPLWYDYFLFPTAFAWGIAAASPRRSSKCADSVESATSSSPRRGDWLSISGLLMALGAAFAAFDYQKILTIYHPWYGAPAVEQRIADGRKALLYGYLADRFAGTLAKSGHRTLEPYKAATRRLLDMRLLIAWSLAMNETGHQDKARYLAQRVKDFNDPVAQQFFSGCRSPSGVSELPWQCTPPSGNYNYRDFLD